MRIAMALVNTKFPPDPRVSKEAGVLLGAGHSIALVAPVKGDQAARESVEGIDVFRRRVHPGSPFARRIDSLRYLLTFDSPSWREAMRTLVRETRAEALHLHDLPYARSAYRAARAAGVPFVLDLHENYPAALALYKRRAIDRLFISPAHLGRLERWAIKRADRVIVVVEEARERLIALGADPDKVVVFGNAEPRSLAEAEAPPLETAVPPRLVYFGGVAAHRGLDTAIDGMTRVRERFPEATLTVIGGGDTLDELQEHAAEAGLGTSVQFLGWTPQAEALPLIATSTVAIVPHHRSPHTDATIPHKLFQYMALGRPVLVSDCAPLARIIRETGAGEVFRAGDAADFAAKVALLAEPERARAAGAAGRAAVLGDYNLEFNARALLTLYDELSARKA